MKYCLSSRQTPAYLKKADEIKIEYRDRNIVPDLAKKYPDKKLILSYNFLTTDDEINWDEIRRFYVLARQKLVLCLDEIEDCQIAKELNIPFYYGFPVSSWAEIRALQELGVAYLCITAPLFFEMDLLKTIDIPIRAVPNVAYRDYFPHADGIAGTWIRPEDVKLYQNYIKVFEFEDCDIQKEQALYRIYKEEKRWPGPLKLLITGLNHEVDNALILREDMKPRLNCQQKCMRPNGTCRICYRVFDLANEDLIKDYKSSQTQEEYFQNATLSEVEQKALDELDKILVEIHDDENN